MAPSHLQPVRGTRDILPEEYAVQHHIIETALHIAECYGYQGMTPPLFEFSDVFKRTLGEGSDVVTKEMYSFPDRTGESLTLRPEFTASIARAFISNGLAHQLPLKFFSAGPLFRYERPQKGRYRQFHQINVECLGITSPQADSEIIALGAHILNNLHILSLTTLQLNSLGDLHTRLAYRTALVEYFSQYASDLSEDSKERLIKSPLRILDSKDARDREISQDAPLIAKYYSSEAAAFFENVQMWLGVLGIQYEVNPRLVRGLDYYTHTAFEFVTSHLGAQGTVMAGGRYDGLIHLMGGPATPAVGFAAGIERLGALLGHPPPPSQRPIVIVPIGTEAEKSTFLLAHTLRHHHYTVLYDPEGSPGKRMKHANKKQAILAIFLGENELAKETLTIRHLDSGTEEIVPAARLLDLLPGWINTP